MNTPHKHAALIHAWADGAEIERKEPDGTWVKSDCPTWKLHYEYRIKPQIEKRRYRVALYLSVGEVTTKTADGSGDEYLIERDPSFHSWLTDWVEYEIEVAP